MSTKLHLDRRTILRGAIGGGAVHVGLPLLEAMLNGNGTALAAGEPLPTCFGTWFWGGGPGGVSEWVPPTAGPGYDLMPALQGMARVKSYVTLISGLNFPIDNGFPHADGQPVSLSGTFDRDANGKSRGGGPTGPSLDQIVANHWNKSGRKASGGIASIAVGIHTEGPYRSGTSFTGPGAFIPSETDPTKVFTRLFGGGLPDPTTGGGANPGSASGPSRANLVKAHRSVLDAVLEDSASLSAGLGAADRRRLAAHLEAVRQIELQVASQAAPSAPAPMGTRACSAPARPAAGGSADERHRIMARLLAMALACDATRVFSVEWAGAQSMAVYPSVKNEAHHPITHTDAAAKKRIGRYVMDRFAEFVDIFMSTQEGPANLLDRTVVWHTAELMDPLAHSPAKLPTHPILLAGRGAGIRAGTHVRRGGGKATMAMLTVLKALGVPANSLGSSNRAGDTMTSETVPELLA